MKNLKIYKILKSKMPLILQIAPCILIMILTYRFFSNLKLTFSLGLTGILYAFIYGNIKYLFCRKANCSKKNSYIFKFIPYNNVYFDKYVVGKDDFLILYLYPAFAILMAISILEFFLNLNSDIYTLYTLIINLMLFVLYEGKTTYKFLSTRKTNNPYIELNAFNEFKLLPDLDCKKGHLKLVRIKLQYLNFNYNLKDLEREFDVLSSNLERHRKSSIFSSIFFPITLLIPSMLSGITSAFFAITLDLKDKNSEAIYDEFIYFIQSNMLLPAVLIILILIVAFCNEKANQSVLVDSSLSCCAIQEIIKDFKSGKTKDELIKELMKP